MSPQFAETENNPFAGIDIGNPAVLQPALVDLEGDGDLDAFIGVQLGFFIFLENTGTPASPAYVRRNSTKNHPMLGYDVGSYSRPAFGDLTGDGRPDAVAGTSRAASSLRELRPAG